MGIFRCNECDANLNKPESLVKRFRINDADYTDDFDTYGHFDEGANFVAEYPHEHHKDTGDEPRCAKCRKKITMIKESSQSVDFITMEDE